MTDEIKTTVKKQFSDMCVIKVSGTKKSFSIIERNGKKKGMLYVTVTNNDEAVTFRFDVWDASKFKTLDSIPENALIRVTGKCSNYNYETSNGEMHYSYDLTMQEVYPYSGKQMACFSFRGRLAKEVTLGSQPGKPYLVFRLAINVGKTPVFITARHYEYSSSFSETAVGDSIQTEGIFTKDADGKYIFFANSVWKTGKNKDEMFNAEPKL